MIECNDAILKASELNVLAFAYFYVLFLVQLFVSMTIVISFLLISLFMFLGLVGNCLQLPYRVYQFRDLSRFVLKSPGICLFA